MKLHYRPGGLRPPPGPPAGAPSEPLPLDSPPTEILEPLMDMFECGLINRIRNLIILEEISDSPSSERFLRDQYNQTQDQIMILKCLANNLQVHILYIAANR